MGALGVYSGVSEFDNQKPSISVFYSQFSIENYKIQWDFNGHLGLGTNHTYFCSKFAGEYN